MAQNAPYSLLYRGNSINAWLSAFLSSVALQQQGKTDIRFVPLCGHRIITSSEATQWTGTHVLLLDMDEQHPAVFMDAGAYSVESISSLSSQDTETSTVVNVWRRWYGEADAPFWLLSADRITRWVAPSWEDRCLREVLMPVAHMPPPDALRATQALMTWMMNPAGVEFQSLMTQGQAKLMEKDLALGALLKAKGVVHDIQSSDAEAWGLTAEWVGLKAFLVENHDFILDTNEAAHLVFMNYPDVALFVNYRKKVRRSEEDGRKLGLVYVYSARSKAFDLTTGGFFHGRAGSAGAQVPLRPSEQDMPFVPFRSEIMMI